MVLSFDYITSICHRCESFRHCSEYTVGGTLLRQGQAITTLRVTNCNLWGIILIPNIQYTTLYCTRRNIRHYHL